MNLSGGFVQIWSFSKRSITIGICVSLVFGYNLWVWCWTLIFEISILSFKVWIHFEGQDYRETVRVKWSNIILVLNKTMKCCLGLWGRSEVSQVLSSNDSSILHTNINNHPRVPRLGKQHLRLQPSMINSMWNSEWWLIVRSQVRSS